MNHKDFYSLPFFYSDKSQVLNNLFISLSLAANLPIITVNLSVLSSNPSCVSNVTFFVIIFYSHKWSG